MKYRRTMLIWLALYLPLGALEIWNGWDPLGVIVMVPAWLLMLLVLAVVLRLRPLPPGHTPMHSLNLSRSESDRRIQG